MLESVDKFKEHFEVSTDAYTGLITLSFEFYSPELSKLWLDKLVSYFNVYVREKEISLINENIAYLEKQAATTNNAGMKAVFYSLMEEQQKKAMLALSSSEYVFKVIDPAVIPEKKFAPKRAIIAVGGTLAGVFLSIILIFVRAFWLSDSN